jgi:hypothetical protein
MKRKILPLTYSLCLWVIGLCLLLVSQYNENMQTIVFIYMFLATPLIIFFAWQQGGITSKEELK